MGANDLIISLRMKGFSIGMHEDRLQISPAEKLSDDLKQTIRESKHEILRALQNATKPDYLDTLATDSAELKTLIAELCRIVGHTEEAKEKMMAAYRSLYPSQIIEQRDFFRLQLKLAHTGNYWISRTKH